MNNDFLLPEIQNELKSIRMEFCEGDYTALDYYLSVSGEGHSTISYQWRDKPHRHVYDLLREIVLLNRQVDEQRKIIDNIQIALFNR